MRNSCFPIDRKSTRLNSSHLVISYAVFCLKKKKREYLSVLLWENSLSDRRGLALNVQHAIAPRPPVSTWPRACGSVSVSSVFFFFFKDTATTEIYPLSLHDALPISHVRHRSGRCGVYLPCPQDPLADKAGIHRSEEHTSELQSPCNLVCRLLLA